MLLCSSHQKLDIVSESDGSGYTSCLACRLVERKDLVQVLDSVHCVIQEANELGLTVGVSFSKLIVDSRLLFPMKDKVDLHAAPSSIR